MAVTNVRMVPARTRAAVPSGVPGDHRRYDDDALAVDSMLPALRWA
jgi:hypothetical protein